MTRSAFRAWARKRLAKCEAHLSAQAIKDRFAADRLFGDDDDHSPDGTRRRGVGVPIGYQRRSQAALACFCRCASRARAPTAAGSVSAILRLVRCKREFRQFGHFLLRMRVVPGWFECCAFIPTVDGSKIRNFELVLQFGLMLFSPTNDRSKERKDKPASSPAS